MEKIDRRKFPRIKVCNPVSIDGVDKDGNLLDLNMGMGLDISQNGILLETTEMINTKYIFLLFVDLENELSKITGRVAFSVKNKNGNFKSGINFQGTQDENIRFAKKIIKAYQYQKTEFVRETKAQL